MSDSLKRVKRHLWKPKTMFYLGMIMIIPFLLLAIAGYFELGILGMFDDYVAREIIDERDPVLTSIFRMITLLGNVPPTILITIVTSLFILLKLKNRWLSLWYLLTVALGAGVLNQVLKYAIRRDRPSSVEHLITQGGYSFPSGHAMGSIIIYGAMIFLILRLSERLWFRIVGTIGLSLLILAIGVSRIYLGVHFPSDIVGGYSVGMMWLTFSIGLYGLSLTKRPEIEKIEGHHYKR
ncbi:phosphatase PAP2 family protein [Marinilactibacillus sp. Marseille-P9653]|uniref:phosphatase PAP2 family protein n=1 Tax=Marinilactibacillus sp. Marseille-P9653 TaxID=2866583 RepID=UPI001CE42126|nr:phosphatase PAP2 family protein [Marinilactibacillus sp. Marseille-P9653]